MAIVATYTPADPPAQAEFYNGIPAHDLDDDDWAQLTEDQQAVIEASALYTMEA